MRRLNAKQPRRQEKKRQEKRGEKYLLSFLSWRLTLASWFLGVHLICFFLGATASADQITNEIGWTVSLDPGSGDYTIHTDQPNWTLAGHVGAAVTNLSTHQASDSVGAYEELRFNWNDAGGRTGGIRLYRDRAIAIFSVTFVDPIDHSPTPFPILTKLPENLLEFRYGKA